MTDYLFPYLASFSLTANLFGQGGWDLSAILDLVALATVLAGVFVVARYREALRAKEAAAEAWREERDAEMAKADRLDGLLTATREELAETKIRVAQLEARPNLDGMYRALVDHDERATQLAHEVTGAIRELTTAITGLTKGEAA